MLCSEKLWDWFLHFFFSFIFLTEKLRCEHFSLKTKPSLTENRMSSIVDFFSLKDEQISHGCFILKILCHDLCSEFEIPLWTPDIRFWGWEVLAWEQAASTSAWPCWGPSSSSPPSPFTGSSPPPTSDWWVQCARKQNIVEIINCDSRQVLDPSAWWKEAWRWPACIFRCDSISSTFLKSLTQIFTQLFWW